MIYRPRTHDHYNERNITFWRRYAEHTDTWLASLMRQSFGWHRYHDPRKNRKPTKRYADGRQRKARK